MTAGIWWFRLWINW